MSSSLFTHYPPAIHSLFVGIEFCWQSHIYHVIMRQFLLKMYTMNILLQILVDVEPPDNICNAIFIGKVIHSLLVINYFLLLIFII